MTHTGIEALKVAVETVGSQTELAKVIGKTQQAVSDVLRRELRVPSEWCIPIERATREIAEEDSSKAIVTRHDLRPDLYPVEEGRAA